MSLPRRPVALVVDDDRDFLALVHKMLDKLGFSAAFAVDADEFLRKFRAAPPDLCLIDLRLGSAMVGFQLLESARLSLGSTIPLFITSAVSDAGIIAHAMELGATDYIVKPIDSETLAAKLSPYFLAEGLASARAPFSAIPKDRQPARISVAFEVRAVDENGLTLVGPNLVAKGTQVRVQDPLVAEMTGEREAVPLTVVNTWAEPELGVYGAYAEFDPAAEALLASVRRWLLDR